MRTYPAAPYCSSSRSTSLFNIQYATFSALDASNTPVCSNCGHQSPMSNIPIGSLPKTVAWCVWRCNGAHVPISLCCNLSLPHASCYLPILILSRRFQVTSPQYRTVVDNTDNISNLYERSSVRNSSLFLRPSQYWTALSCTSRPLTLSRSTDRCRSIQQLSYSDDQSLPTHPSFEHSQYLLMDTSHIIPA